MFSDHLILHAIKPSTYPILPATPNSKALSDTHLDTSLRGTLDNMATDAALIEASSATSHNLTAAERLREKHEADAAHHPMVEDVVDEDDIAHPLSSMHSAPEPEATPTAIDANAPMSEKAAGKQKANDEPLQNPTVAKTNGFPSLNTQSEEVFPALGGAPKASAPAPTARAWGAQRPSTIHAGLNGTNGHVPLSSMASSRASTPTSGVLPPVSTNPTIQHQPRGLSIPQHMPMPGRHSERIHFAPSQLMPRDQLKKPLQETLRALNKRSKANVEMKPGPNGVIIFEGTGPVDATRQALKDLAKEVGSKVSRPSPSLHAELIVNSNKSRSQCL